LNFKGGQIVSKKYFQGTPRHKGSRKKKAWVPCPKKGKNKGQNKNEGRENWCGIGLQQKKERFCF